jgi:hypothetical protein
MTEETLTLCPWCERPFRARRGGSPQRFCGSKCRATFWSALRRWGERAVAAGILVDRRHQVRRSHSVHASWSRHLAPAGIQPGEVLDAAEIVEDKPSGAQPGPEPTQPFEVDPASLWGPRLSLWLRRRMWMSGWGPRPDQDGCQAPDYLL